MSSNPVKVVVVRGTAKQLEKAYLDAQKIVKPFVRVVMSIENGKPHTFFRPGDLWILEGEIRIHREGISRPGNGKLQSESPNMPNAQASVEAVAQNGVELGLWRLDD